MIGVFLEVPDFADDRPSPNARWTSPRWTLWQGSPVEKKNLTHEHCGRSSWAAFRFILLAQQNIYNRIALDHDIIVQVKDITPLTHGCRDHGHTIDPCHLRCTIHLLHETRLHFQWSSSVPWFGTSSNETSEGERYYGLHSVSNLEMTPICKVDGRASVYHINYFWLRLSCSLVWIVPMVVYASNVSWDARLKTQLLAIMAELKEQ